MKFQRGIIMSNSLGKIWEKVGPKIIVYR